MSDYWMVSKQTFQEPSLNSVTMKSWDCILHYLL